MGYEKVTFSTIQVFENEIIDRPAAKSNANVNLILMGITLF